MLRTSLPLLALLVPLACSRSSVQEGSEPPHPVLESHEPSAASATITAELTVEGVDCASCSLGIQKALRGLPGIVDVRKGPSKSHVLVDFAPEHVSAEVIMDAVLRAGFDAEMFVHERT